MENQWLFDEDYCEHITLRDGARLRIRPVRPADKAKLAETFRGISDESRYRRCFSLKNELTPEELNFFCDVDGINHFALGAVLLNEDNQEEDGIGGVRFIRLAENVGVAEVAFLVADAWQRRGIGQLLLERLVDAAVERGINKLRCYLLTENVPARHFISSVSRNICWDISFQNDGALLAVELSIEKSALAESVTADIKIFDLLELAAKGYLVVPAALVSVASNIWWQEERWLGLFEHKIGKIKWITCPC